MHAIRHAISPPDAAFRRLLMLSLAISGIVLGLVSMHTISSSNASSLVTTAGSVSGAGSVGVAEHAGTMPADAASKSCEMDCGPVDHEMLSITLCVSTLLASLLIVATRLASWRQRQRWGPAVARLSEILRAVAVPPAPASLHVLSVIRT